MKSVPINSMHTHAHSHTHTHTCFLSCNIAVCRTFGGHDFPSFSCRLIAPILWVVLFVFCQQVVATQGFQRALTTLQPTATHCNPLQPTATHCNTLQPTATHCNTQQHTTTHCNTMQYTATHCSTLRHQVVVSQGI